MKKHLVLFLFLLFAGSAFGQYAYQQSDVKSQGYYYSKYRSQNRAGTILAVGGTTLIVIGAVGVISNFDLGNGNSDENKRAGIFSYVFLTGVAADVISIPILLSAHANKRKSSLSIHNQKIYLPQNGTMPFQTRVVPSFTLHVTI